jgi:hypothetical protein
MNEMKPEDVMKALECCTSGRPCRECEYKDKSKDTFGCRKGCLIDALALLREKAAEIERLTEENDGLEATNKILTTNNADLEAELALTYDLLEESKSDTVMKMQERLKAKAKAHYFDNCDYAVSVENIDQIAKEMLEANE